jgi:hypothetical protein
MKHSQIVFSKKKESTDA